MAYDGSLVFDTKVDEQGFNSGIKKLGGVAKKGLKAMTAAIAAAGTALLGAATAGVKYNAQMEQYVASFQTMLGNAEKAQKTINDLKTLAAKTPLEMGDLAKGAQTLIAFKYSAEKTVPMLKRIGDVALGDAEKMQSLTLAFAQCQSTGKLMGQDLLQMINAGFNPLAEIARTSGKSVAQLKDEMSKGAISAKMVEDAFVSATEAGGQFFGAMEAQSRTFNGQLSTLKDNAKALLGDLTAGITNKLKDKALPAVNGYIEQLQAAFSRGGLNSAISEFGNVLADAVNQITKAAPKWIKAGTTLIKSLLTGLKKNSKEIARGALELIMSLIDSILSLLPEIVKTGDTLLVHLLDGFADKLPELIPEVVATFFEILTQSLVDTKKLIVIGFRIIEGIFKGLSNAMQELFWGIGDTLTAIFTNDFEIAGAVEDEMTEAYAVAESIYQNFQTATEDCAESVSNAFASHDAAQELVGRLEELQSATNRTAAEQYEMVSIVDQLNALYPSLGLEIDKVTGELNMSTDSICKSIDALKEYAVAEAYIEKYKDNVKRLVEMQTQQAVLQNKVNTAVNETIPPLKNSRNEAQKFIDAIKNGQLNINANRKELEKLGVTIDDLNPTLDTESSVMQQLNTIVGKNSEAIEVQNGIVAEAKEGISYYSEGIAKLTEENAILEEKYDTLSKSIEETDGAMESLILTWGNASVEMSPEMLSQLGMTAEEASAKFNELKGTTQEMFSVIREEGGMSAAQLKKNLDQNTEDTVQWAADMKTLYSRLPEDLAAALEEKGPVIGNTIHNLATTEDLQPLIDSWHNAGSGALEAMGIGLEGAPETVEGVVRDSAKAVDDDNSLEVSVTAKMQVVKSTMQNQVTALRFNQIGKDIVNGLILGMGQMRGALEAKAKELARDAAKAMRTALDSHSPSKLFEKIGITIPQGAASGIGRGTELVKDAMNRMNGIMVGGYGTSSYSNSYVTNTTNRNQTIQFFRPEESPSETARALERLERSLVYGS